MKCKCGNKIKFIKLIIDIWDFNYPIICNDCEEKEEIRKQEYEEAHTFKIGERVNIKNGTGEFSNGIVSDITRKTYEYLDGMVGIEIKHFVTFNNGKETSFSRHDLEKLKQD